MEVINILIVHFNTPKLTECLIKSINKYTPNCNIYIFDNSDKQPFTYRQDNITYYDNTNGQIIDFSNDDKSYSLRHCRTIQKCMELIPEDFILMDSDILLKKDVTSIVDKRFAFVGQVEQPRRVWKNRAVPFLLYVNVKMVKEKNIRFYDENRIVLWGYSRDRDDNYDTGASFLEDVRKANLPRKPLCLNDYIVHFAYASHGRSEEEIDKWIKANNQYWE